MPLKAPKEITTKLPKSVRDRIRRYAEEGRVPRERYDRNGCFLLAVAHWRLPMVLLRSTPDKFPELRHAALIEWTRAARRKRSLDGGTKRRTSGSPLISLTIGGLGNRKIA